MEGRTQLIIALTSVITSAFTVGLSNFLAPRINSWYERKYRDSLVLKKTLRILLEIEIYVQRKLKLPSLDYYIESVIPKIRELGYLTDEEVKSLSAAFPQLLQSLQPQLMQKLPDKSEALDREFALILTELSTVDPLLAYRISEKHSVSPVQNLENNVFDSVRALGIVIREDDHDVQRLRKLVQSEKSAWIDELLADLRKDILSLATRIGKKDLEEIESYFSDLDVKRRKEASRLAEQVAKLVVKENQGVEAQAADSSSTEI